jgi:hypothetical protein
MKYTIAVQRKGEKNQKTKHENSTWRGSSGWRFKSAVEISMGLDVLRSPAELERKASRIARKIQNFPQHR